MRSLIITCALTLFNWVAPGQNTGTWNAFRNNDSSLIGFRDNEGNVKIEPKFTGFTSARIFDRIIAVTEEENDNYLSYYLTKTGKTAGIDSLYLSDNAADCESEGFIRFRDKKTDRAGMFNSYGEVAIPAVYNDLTRVMNGLVVALQGAEKKNEDPDNQSGCNHFGWIGGREMLIDTSNTVLIADFKYDDDLFLFSLNISDQPDSETIRRHFPGTNGKYYSFIDFDKEFREWLKKTLLDNCTKSNLLGASYPEITFWMEPDGWKTEPNSSFTDKNFKILKTKLLELNSAGCKYDISGEGLNPFIYDSDGYRDFFNNCGESKDWIYPVKTIIISHTEPRGFYQDHLDFLRTDHGYKLIGISFAEGEID